MRISDGSSDVCSSDLVAGAGAGEIAHIIARRVHVAFAGDEDDPHLAVALGCRECIGKCAIHGVGERVLLVRAIEDQLQYAVRLRDPYMVRHIISFRRSAEPTSELPSLMRLSYAVFCLK